MSAAGQVRVMAFEAGRVRTSGEWIYWNQRVGESVIVPVPFFVVTHPQGNVLVDGGFGSGLIEQAMAGFDEAPRTHVPLVSRDDACLNRLGDAGIDPESIRFVVQTHLHNDHSGAINSFPGVSVVVQDAELRYALEPEWFARMAYVPDDISGDVVWVRLKDTEEAFDLFGDGSVRLLSTPGHSPGHMSVLVRPQHGRPVVLAGDAAYTDAHFDNRALPGFFHSADETIASVQRLRAWAAQSGALVVFGHDAEQWPQLPKAPVPLG